MKCLLDIYEPFKNKKRRDYRRTCATALTTRLQFESCKHLTELRWFYAHVLLSSGLLENKNLNLSMTVDQATTLDISQKCSESYAYSFTPTVNVIAEVESDRSAARTCAIIALKNKCYFCGGSSHDHNWCLAKEAIW